MITYEGATPEITTRENIIVRGIIIGRIWKTDHGYQCQLGRFSTLHGAETLNGIGRTKEFAIKDAIASMKKEIGRKQEALEWLEGKI